MKPFVLITVLDGMRRDQIRPDTMPVLHRFLAEGCDFVESSCVFPSATRVNAAALSTGAWPGRNGIVSNKFHDRRTEGGRLVHTGLLEDILAAEAAHDGGFITSATLGDAMAAAGLRFAVVSSGSAGTTHMTSPRASKHGQVSICLSDWRACTPEGYAAELLDRFGPIQPVDMPNAARMVQQTDMFLDGVYPDIQPDAAVLWYNDPDLTFHYKGIGSAEALAALAALDQQFARLLAWAHSPAPGRPVDIIVLSDHGHITARDSVEAKAALGPLLTDGLNGTIGYVGGIHAEPGAEQALQAFAEKLVELPWCGLVFSRARDGHHGIIPGSFAREMLFNDHERSPDLFFSLRTADSANAAGVTGGCFFEGDVPEGGSTHGGLMRQEMNSLLAMAGPSFRPAKRFGHGAGIVDIAPTVLSLLGISAPASMQGRILREAFVAGTEPGRVDRETFRIDTARGEARLDRLIVDGWTYLHSAGIA